MGESLTKAEKAETSATKTSEEVKNADANAKAEAPVPAAPEAEGAAKAPAVDTFGESLREGSQPGGKSLEPLTETPEELRVRQAGEDI
jgi:membrane protein involved in colicin uptake